MSLAPRTPRARRDLLTRTRCVVACAAALLAGCQTTPPPPTDPQQVGEFRAGSGYLKGYLNPKTLPNSLALLPRPPAPGSAQQAADDDAYRSTRALRGTPRWAQAHADVQLKWPAAADTFSCALDLPIAQAATPHLNMLLRRSLLDAGLATYAAKNHYARMRPFVAGQDMTCAPEEEKALLKDGAYPSGHAALGWAWALILTELAPERADALLARGYAFGQSRMVCGVHWQSDVDAGRVVGAAAVAQLHTDPVFSAQLAAAKAEVADARAKGARSPRDCAAELSALKP